MPASTVNNFQALLSLVDEDCIVSGKERLYYKVELDGRQDTNTLVRSVRRRNNTPAVSFLIKTTHETDEYSILYLSQIDIIEVISLMDEDTRTHLWSCLFDVYLNTFDTSCKSILFAREPINSELDLTRFTLNGDAIIIPLPDQDYKVHTSFGFDISYHDLCDCISLMLSMEPSEKLKTVLSKYFVLSELLAGRETLVAPPGELAHAKNASDLRAAYDNISTKIEEREQYDIEAFGRDRYSSCFQKQP